MPLDVAYDPTRALMALATSPVSIEVQRLEDNTAKSATWLEDDGFRCHQGPLSGPDSRWTPCDSITLPQEDEFRGSSVTCLALGPATTTRVLAVGTSTGHVLIYEVEIASRRLSDSPTFSSRDTLSPVTALGFADPPGTAADQGPGAMILAASFCDGFVRTYLGTLDALTAARGGDVRSTMRSWCQTNVFCASNDVSATASGGGAPPALCLAWRPFSLASLPQGAAVEPIAPMIAVGTQQGASVWTYSTRTNGWTRAAVLREGAPCTCVDWAANHGNHVDLVATGRGAHVEVHGVSGRAGSLAVSRVATLEPEAGSGPVCKVEFDLSGLQLAASYDGPVPGVKVFAPNLAGVWECVLRVLPKTGSA